MSSPKLWDLNQSGAVNADLAIWSDALGYWGPVSMSGEATITALGVVTLQTVSSVHQGAIPAYPNNTTTYWRGDGSYANLAAAAFAAQSANAFLAGPTSGGSAVPTFRSIVAADLASSPTTNYFLQYSGSVLQWAAGNAGTVTSVALSMPSIFSVAGSPITGSGTFTVTLATESANTIFAGPTTGAAAGPTFRSLVASDLASSPSTNYFLQYSGSVLQWAAGNSGTVTSVALSMPSIFSVAGSPITGSGTFTVTLATESANTIFAGPTTGAAAGPTFRSLVGDDLPAVTSLAKGAIGAYPNNTTTFYRGDGSYANLAAAAFAAQTANTVLAGPTSGGSAVPTFRAIGATDLAASPVDTYVLQYSGTSMVWATAPGGSPTGSAGGDLSGTYPNPTVSKISGVAYNADPLTQYALLAGRSGGQTLIGGTAASNSLTLQSTSHSTKGKLLFGTAAAYDEVNDRLGIGTTAPVGLFDVVRDAANPTIFMRVAGTSVNNQLVARRARGTIASPTAVDTSDVVYQFLASPYINSGYQFPGEIRWTMGTTVSNTSYPIFCSFFTTPEASTTKAERMRIWPGGSVDFGINGAIATNATAGQTGLAISSGLPTGTPEVGAGAIQYDTTNKVPAHWDGTLWRSMFGANYANRQTGASASVTCGSNDVYIWDYSGAHSGGGITYTLPSAATVRTLIFVHVQGGDASNPFTISVAGSDKICNTSSLTNTSITMTTNMQVRILQSDGQSPGKWLVIGSI